MSHQLAAIARLLNERSLRYLVIGVAGANLYAPAGQAVFATRDIDLFLPPDPANLLAVWQICQRQSLALWTGAEPLEQPLDRALAERVVERRALTRAVGPHALELDLTLVMSGFDFEPVWEERREFVVDGVPVSTARLLHIRVETCRGKTKGQTVSRHA